MIRLLLFYFRYSPRFILFVVVVGAVGGASSAALMALISAHLSQAQLPAESSIWRFTGLVLIVLLATCLSRVLMVSLTHRTTFDLRMHLCRQVVGKSLRELEETGSNRIMAALTEDISQLASTLMNVPALFINLAILIGCLIYLGWLSLSALIFLLAFLAMAILTTRVPEGRANRILGQAREHWDVLVGHFRVLTDGIKELKLHLPRREAFLSGPLYTNAASFRRDRLRGGHIYALTNSWAGTLYFTFVGSILFGVPLFTKLNTHALIGYTLTVLYMKAPIEALLDMLPTFAQGRVSLNKIERLGFSLDAVTIKKESLSQMLPAQSPDSAVKPLSSCERIELLGITHRYYREREERDFVLGPIDLTIYAGELVFLVGGNGSGKTTFAKLLTGLYAPEAGEIRLNGQPITDERREWYGQHFSVVFSDFHLFENLLGLETPARNLDTKAYEYLVQLQLDHKVQVRDGNLSTTNLSQGQRKRLALLTAYLEDRPFYIFDEWAADQDPRFKQIFYFQLLPDLKARGKTLLVISHDDHYYHVADRIVKLDYGKLERDEYVTPAYLGSVERQVS